MRTLRSGDVPGTREVVQFSLGSRLLTPFSYEGCDLDDGLPAGVRWGGDGVGERDDAWFDDLYRSHATPVWRYFARRAAVDDADDLAAEVFATAWRRRDDVPDGAELPWLYRTAGFVLANHRRKHRPLPVAELPERSIGNEPEMSAIEDDGMRRALAALGERDRRILYLHAWEGLTGEGLAEALGISRGGADAALSRARSRLAAAWDEEGA